LIFAKDILLYGDILITEKQPNFASQYRKTGHKVNAEKFELMFLCLVKKTWKNITTKK
jgi:hypothetical protein